MVGLSAFDIKTMVLVVSLRELKAEIPLNLTTQNKSEKLISLPIKGQIF